MTCLQKALNALDLCKCMHVHTNISNIIKKEWNTKEAAKDWRERRADERKKTRIIRVKNGSTNMKWCEETGEGWVKYIIYKAQKEWKNNNESL